MAAKLSLTPETECPGSPSGKLWAGSRFRDPAGLESLRRLTFGMSAATRLTGRPGGDVLAAEIAAVPTLLGLTAATLVRALLHNRYLLSGRSLMERDETTDSLGLLPFRRPED